MTRRRPPDQHHRTQTATTLRALADTLEGTNASAIMTNVGVASEIGYAGSTAAPEIHNGTDEDGIPVQPHSPAERPVFAPDPEAARAQRLIAAYFQMTDLAHLVTRGIEEWNPDRAVRVCNRCGYPLEKRRERCQRINEDGVQCGASADAWPACVICQEGMPPDDRHGSRHNACRQNANRPAATRSAAVELERGRATIKAVELELGGIITDDGAYIGD